MHIHILGICGTFMGSLAILARAKGHKVTGSDANVYPPMSTLLENQGIELIEGYDPQQLEPAPDMVIIGNAMTRGILVLKRYLKKDCLTHQGHNGYMTIFCLSVGFWPLRVPMVKRLRQVCWLGF